MATLTATAMSRPARSLPSGVISQTVEFNSGATQISASATTVLLTKIPNQATILDILVHHTAGSATCPVDYGIDSTLSALISQATLGVITRASVVANIPYKVSLSDDAANNYAIFKATATPGTATASLKIKATIYYTMDP